MNTSSTHFNVNPPPLVVDPAAPQQQQQDDDDPQVAVVVECSLVGFLPFTSKGESNDWPASASDHAAADSLGSDNDEGGQRQRRRINWQMSQIAAAVMAVDHLNQRSNVVVPNLSTLMENCTTPQLTVHFNLTKFVNTDKEESNIADYFLLQRQATKTNICGIVGMEDNLVAETMGLLAKSLQIPVITHQPRSNDLTRVDRYPYVARTTVNHHPRGEAVANWLARIGRTSHVAVITTTTSQGGEATLGLINGLTERNITNVTPYTFDVGKEAAASIDKILTKVKREGYRTLVLWWNSGHFRQQGRGGPGTFGPNHIQTLVDFVNAAQHHGLITPQHVWVVPDTWDLPHLLQEVAPQNTNLTQLLKGAAMIRPLDGFDYTSIVSPPNNGTTTTTTTDPLEEAWRRNQQQTAADLVERINDLYPIKEATTTDKEEGKPMPGYYQAPSSYFATQRLQPGAAFLYDAIIAQGLGKCKYEYDQQRNNNNLREEDTGGNSGSSTTPSQQETETPPQQAPDNNNPKTRRGRRRGLKGVIHKTQQQRALQEDPQPNKTKKKKKAIPPPTKMKAIYDQPFQGATGRVAFGEGGGNWAGSRQRQDVTFGVYNIREEEIVGPTEDPNNVTLRYYLTHVLHKGPVQGTWHETPSAPFLYSSGSSLPPNLLRDPPNQNFLKDPVQYVGWSVFAVLVLYILGSLGFVVAFRETPAIRQNQPIFLSLMLFGCLMVSTAILTVSMDEQDGISQEGLSAMCLSTLWLLVVGYIFIYAALFCKLWRINRVLSFTRRKVEFYHVIGPMVGVTIAAILTLSLWTVLDPFVWVREEVDVVSGESYGSCSSNNSLPYLLSVIGLTAITTVGTAAMAWKAKDIDERFSEAKWIFYTIFVQMQLLILGVPVLVILGTESADATFMGRFLLIFLVVATTVSLMIGPKAVRVFQEWREMKTDRGGQAQNTPSTWSAPSANGAASRGGTIGGPTRISGLDFSIQSKKPTVLEAMFKEEEKKVIHVCNDRSTTSLLTCEGLSSPMDDSWNQSVEAAKEMQQSKERQQDVTATGGAPETTSSKQPSEYLQACSKEKQQDSKDMAPQDPEEETSISD